MKREQVLLVLTLLVLAWMVRGELAREAPRATRPRFQPVPPLELGPVDAWPVLEHSPARRDVFREPTEIEALPPLDLPLPPVPEMARLLPPPVPDSGPARWSDHLLQWPEAPPGEAGEAVDLDFEDAGLGAGDSFEEAEAADPVGLDGAQEEDYARLYDRVDLEGSFRPLWGWILNEDRFDRAAALARGQVDLVFQEVDPRTGQPRFEPRPIAADAYTRAVLADTLRNRIELARRALPDNAGAFPEREDLVRWLLQVGNEEPLAYDYAVQAAVRGVELSPEALDAWLLLGEAWERTFRLDEAFALYAFLAGEELPGPAPELPVQPEPGRFRHASAPRVRMASILLAFGLREDAATMLRRALELGDGDPRAYALLGELLLEEDPSEALGLLERAYGSPALDRASETGLGLGVALGTVHLALGHWDDAERVFRQTGNAAGLVAGAREIPEGAVDAACGLAAAAYLRGDFSAALARVEEFLAIAGPHRKLLYLRGIAGAAAGSPLGEVARDLRAAAAVSPLDAALPLAALSFWLDVKARAVGDEALREEAGVLLDQALELDPGLPWAVAWRARFALDDDNLEAAREDLRRFIQDHPDCAAALMELGWILHREERYDTAEVALRRAEQEAPRHADLVLRRGLNLLKTGDLDLAREVLARALSLDPGLAAASNGIAWAHYAEGDVTGARAEFAQVMDELRTTPDNPQYRYAELWSRRIEAHSRLVRWVDRFEGRLLRPVWNAIDDLSGGVEPRVFDGALRIEGEQEPGRTRVFRRIRAIDFQSAAATLTVGSGHQGKAGLMLSLERRRGAPTWLIQIERQRNGEVTVYGRQGAREFPEPEEQRTGIRVSAGQPLRVSFVLDREPEIPVLHVRVDGREVFQGEVPTLRSTSGDLTISVYSETANVFPVQVLLDDFELVYSQP